MIYIGLNLLRVLFGGIQNLCIDQIGALSGLGYLDRSVIRDWQQVLDSDRHWVGIGLPVGVHWLLGYGGG